MHPVEVGTVTPPTTVVVVIIGLATVVVVVTTGAAFGTQQSVPTQNAFAPAARQSGSFAWKQMTVGIFVAVAGH